MMKKYLKGFQVSAHPPKKCTTDNGKATLRQPIRQHISQLSYGGSAANNRRG